jgi:A nuclease of the HNH/ENDO VII superfamily with conserved WHH
MRASARHGSAARTQHPAARCDVHRAQPLAAQAHHHPAVLDLRGGMPRCPRPARNRAGRRQACASMSGKLTRGCTASCAPTRRNSQAGRRVMLTGLAAHLPIQCEFGGQTEHAERFRLTCRNVRPPAAPSYDRCREGAERRSRDRASGGSRRPNTRRPGLEAAPAHSRPGRARGGGTLPSPGGDAPADVERAIEMARSYRRNQQLTWHHVEFDTVLQLVPRPIHEAAQHAGGIATQAGL